VIEQILNQIERLEEPIEKKQINLSLKKLSMNNSILSLVLLSSKKWITNDNTERNHARPGKTLHRLREACPALQHKVFYY